ncbi:MAG: hypothetical protein A2W19_14040 [Spirochaetes bacterium RBG_16_49_21]|nr:MAG: hypothetical protein A2W19_14040 [Spirochaetes bacterium RBG_16_49_21]
MNSTKIYKLNDLCVIIGGNPAPKGSDAFTDEGMPFLKMKDFGKYHTTRNLLEIENKVSNEVAKRNNLKIIKKGSVLLPRSGSVALNHRAVLGVDAYMVSHICALEVKDCNKLNNEYLYYYLCRINMTKITKKTTGLDAITFVDLGKIKIPVPPLEDQIRIATLLSRIEELIAKRKESIQLLDEFVKSTFLEMFGDPVRNEKGWDVKLLSKIGQFISGGTPSKEREDYWNGNFPWVSPKDMKVSYIFDSQDHISEKVFHETSLKRINFGHILIVVRGMILAHSFPVAINMVPVSINQDMKAIQLEEEINVQYMMNCLISMKRLILSSITTAGHGTKRFDSNVMNKIMIPVPPLPLQNKFANIVEKVESVKVKYQNSFSELEKLYGAVSQRAFRGEICLYYATSSSNIR